MKFFLTIFCVFIFCMANAQADSAVVVKHNVPKKIVAKPIKPKVVDSLKFNKTRLPESRVDSIKISDSASAHFINDSTKYKDSIQKLKDSTDKIIAKKDTSTYKLLTDYPILSNNKPELMITAFKEPVSKDILFYALLLVVVVFAIVKLIFPRYIKSIFSIIFQTQFRQIQTREQLLQDNVASMLLNILFIISTSFFIALYLNNISFIKYGFWYVALAACLIMVSIYLFKLLFTQFMGWIFNKSNAASTYTFIVFIINKILGIILLPLLFLIAFSDHLLAQKIINISLVIMLVLLLFRLVITYKSVSSILKTNAFHFFLYFCCIEILPLLIMFKFLNNYISNGI